MTHRKFVTSIGKRIADLENFHFGKEEVNNFKVVMKLEGKRASAGIASFTEKPVSVTFLGAVMKLQMLSVNDEWNYRFEARMRSIGISSKQLDRLPWEEAIWGTDQIPGMPETIVIPLELLQDCKHCRAAALRILKSFDTRSMTFTDMKSALNSVVEEELKGLDRFFVLDLEFFKKSMRPRSQTRK